MGTLQQIRGITTDTADLVAEALEQGWSVEERNGRLYWRPASAAFTAVYSGKRLAGRELANIRGMLRQRGLVDKRLRPAAGAVRELHQPKPQPTVNERSTRAAKANYTRAANRAAAGTFMTEAATVEKAVTYMGGRRELAQALDISDSAINYMVRGKYEIKTQRMRAAYMEIAKLALAQQEKEDGEERAREFNRALKEEGQVLRSAEPVKVAAEAAPEPAAEPEPQAASGDAQETLQEDVEALAGLLEELVRRRVRGAQERITRLENELTDEKRRCADLRDENEKLRTERGKLQERMTEIAQKAAQEAIKSYLS